MKDGMVLYNTNVTSLTNFDTLLTELRQALKSHVSHVMYIILAINYSLITETIP